MVNRLKKLLRLISGPISRYLMASSGSSLTMTMITMESTMPMEMAIIVRSSVKRFSSASWVIPRFLSLSFNLFMEFPLYFVCGLLLYTEHIQPQFLLRQSGGVLKIAGDAPVMEHRQTVGESQHLVEIG